MQGLSIAPLISSKGEISYKDVEYLIVPNDALGSSAVLSSIENNINIATVKNETILDVTQQKIGFSADLCFESYEQCLTTIKRKIKTKI